MNYLVFVTTILAILFLSSCGPITLNVDFHVPTYSLITPETTGAHEMKSFVLAVGGKF